VKSEKGNILLVVVVILALLFAGAAGFLYFQNQQLKRESFQFIDYY